MEWVTRASDDARVGMMPRGRVASFLGRAGRQQLTVASRAPGTIRMGKQGMPVARSVLLALQFTVSVVVLPVTGRMAFISPALLRRGVRTIGGLGNEW